MLKSEELWKLVKVAEKSNKTLFEAICKANKKICRRE